MLVLKNIQNASVCLEGNLKRGTFLHLTSICCCPKTNLGKVSNIFFFHQNLSICGIFWKSIIILIILSIFKFDCSYGHNVFLSNKIGLSGLRI